MKQLSLQGVTPFADAPMDAPEDVLLDCHSEAEAVRRCLEFAKRHGITQKTVATFCGWKSSSYLSEIANPGNEKVMPEDKRRRFAFITGWNLVDQWHAREELKKRLNGKQTENDRRNKAVDLMVAAYERRAA